MDKYQLKDILFTARHKKKLTLKQVESRAYISLGTLEALESGRYEYVPSMVYLKGQLKKLSDTYGLDADKIITLCSEEYNDFQQKKIRYQQSTLSKNTSNENPWLKLFIDNAQSIVVGSGVVLPILFFFIFQIRTLLLVPKVALNIKDGLEITEQKNYILQGKTEPSVQLTLNGQSVTIQPQGQFETEVQLHFGYNVLQLKAKQRSQESIILDKVVYVKENENE
jgi:transcriptional regulator with XRE-family HTH domain